MKWVLKPNGLSLLLLPPEFDFSTELINILDERFNSERPNAVWCTDITYIWTQNGFVYLNCVIDLFARKIIAWTLSNTMEVSNVVATINKAKAYRNIELPLIIHSDRGSQYVSNAWREATKTTQLSYSRCAYPYDNVLNTLKPFTTLSGLIVTVMSPDEFEKIYNKTHVLPAS